MNTIDRDKLIAELESIIQIHSVSKIAAEKCYEYILSLPTNTESLEVEGWYKLPHLTITTTTQPLTIEEAKDEVARNSVFIVQGETLLLHGCFSTKEKADKYISGNNSLKIQEVEVV